MESCRLWSIRSQHRIFTVLMCCLIGILSLLFPGFAIAQGPTWAWGSNSNGQLGDGSSTISGNPTPSHPSGITNVIQVAAGSYFSLVLKNNGSVWSCGTNLTGALGIGSHDEQHSLTQIAGFANVTRIAAGALHALAVKQDGTAWAWGDNYYGELGDGTEISRTAPVLIPGFSNVAQLSAGSTHSLAVKHDGTVWAWGDNRWGQVGDGTASIFKQHTPLQVIGLSNVAQVAAGTAFSLALKQDGTVWAWGIGSGGALGQGEVDRSDHLTPVEVAGLTQVTQIAAGSGFALALKRDGTVWAWGDNTYGQLGDGIGGTFGGSVASPIQVIGLTSVAGIASGNLHSLAVKQDGTAWGWGYNHNGETGGPLNDGLPIPRKIVGLSNIIGLSGGGNHSLAFGFPDSTIIALNASGKPGDVVKLTANLKRTSTNAALVGTLNFKIDGIAVGSALTNSKGAATFSWKVGGAYAAGAHAITVSFDGNSDYGAALGSAVFTLLSTNANITLPAAAGRAGDTLKLIATLKRAGDNVAIINTPLIFKVDGVTIGAANTATTGAATLTWVISDIFTAGTHFLTAETTGPTGCISTPGSSILTVVLTPTVIAPTAASAKAGATTTLKGKLTRTSDKKPVAGRTVRFQVDGVEVGQGATDTTGTAICKYLVPKTASLGIHPVIVLFDGDGSYASSSAPTTLTVK